MFRYVLAFTVFALAALTASADFLLVKVDLEQFNYSSLTAKQVTFLPYTKDGPTQWIYANFDLGKLKAPKVFPVDKVQVISIDHNWGKRGTIPVFNCVVVDLLPHESLSATFAKKKKKEAPQSEPDALLRLAGWALARGLSKDFHATMEELQKKAPTRPAVQSYLVLKKALKQPLTSDDPTTVPLLNDLRSEGYKEQVSDQGHFVLLYKPTVAEFTPGNLKRRLSRMEGQLENIYYWFALQEKVALPPLPRHRLAVQLIDSAQEFWKRHREWESPAQVGDGFFLRPYNLAVLCARRVDDAYLNLEKNLQPVRNTLSLVRNELLAGEVWTTRPEFLKSPNDAQVLSTVQMLTILQKVMEEDSEKVTIDHLCTRQILGATGMLPRRVYTPEWIQWGVASFFETPPGSLYPNFGQPSIDHFLTFKELRRKKKLGKSSDVLVNLLNDNYFRQAHQDQELLRELKEEVEGETTKEGDKTRRELLTDKIKENLDLAHSTSWALVYYLTLTRKTDYLTRYCRQLDDLPRDLELNQTALEACFARAFQLESPSNPMKLDPGKVQAFANAWFQEMESVNLDISALETFRNKVNPPPTEDTTSKDPMKVGFPMPKLPGGK